jgi:hypothetical protein
MTLTFADDLLLKTFEFIIYYSPNNSREKNFDLPAAPLNKLQIINNMYKQTTFKSEWCYSTVSNTSFVNATNLKSGNFSLYNKRTFTMLHGQNVMQARYCVALT